MENAGVEDPLNGPFWNEGNFDGDTDISDFNLLASNFSPAGYATSAIPEPSTLKSLSVSLAPSRAHNQAKSGISSSEAHW